MACKIFTFSQVVTKVHHALELLLGKSYGVKSAELKQHIVACYEENRTLDYDALFLEVSRRVRPPPPGGAAVARPEHSLAAVEHLVHAAASEEKLVQSGGELSHVIFTFLQFFFS